MRGLALGAFERDNFGDTLFLYVLQDALDKHELVPVSTFETTLPDGQEVKRFTDLQFGDWDFIWSVGGEIGAVSVLDALRMSLPPSVGRVLGSSSNFGTNMFSELISGRTADSPAYLWESSIRDNHNKIKLIANSVGVGRLKDFSDSKVAENSIKSLSLADWVSVRDQHSASYLQNLCIDSVISPDIVHISRYSKNLFAKRQELETGMIVFQINEHLVDMWSRPSIADALVKLISHFDLDICLIAAGIATGHDKFASLIEISTLANQKLSTNRVKVETSRDPLKISKIIINSKMWIGSSLHGRILATSFDLPRVSLLNDKVSPYCINWDSKLPHGVTLDSLLEASELAVNQSQNKEVMQETAALSELALSNLQRAESVLSNDSK